MWLERQMTRKQPKRKSRIGVDEYGRTPLHYAALNGDIERVHQLLRSGANSNSQDDDGWTPLHFASQECHKPIVEALLQGGADPNISDIHGNGPLWTAIMRAKGETEVIELLLRSEADPRHTNRYGRSPYDMATTIGQGLENLFVSLR